MKRIVYFLLLLAMFQSCSVGNSGDNISEEGYDDGTYCADVEYYNPNTGTRSEYTLEVEVENNEVTKIYWNNGGWLDEDHFSAEELDADGECSFTSDRGYEYTVKITGQNCSNLDSEGQHSKMNLPKYSFEEAVAMTGMTQEEINDCNIYSEGDVLSENDMFILKREIESIRAYLNAIHGYDQGYNEDIEDIKRSQKKLQDEIDNGYVQRIERKSMYGVSIQTVTISKYGVNYLFEVRGGGEVTMGTAQFNENATGWQTVYIKQYPDVEKYSGYSMRIIDSGF